MNQKLVRLFAKAYGYVPTPADEHIPVEAEKFYEEILKEVISTIYRADYIAEKKADMLVDDIAIAMGYK